MKYFNRLCVVEISPDIHIEGLKIKFNVKKDTRPDRNSFRVDIYNLSDETRSRLSNDADSLVRIQAGYESNGGLVEICQGNISTVSHSVSRPDVITTIHCKDGFKATRANLISISFRDGTPLYTIIETLTEELGLPVRFANYNRNAILQGGFSYLGSLNDCMDVLSDQFDFQWSIQDGQLQIIENDGNTGKKVVFLSPSTGLISEPEEVIIEKELLENARGQYEVVALLQPQMQVGDIVVVDSSNLKGNFVVNDLDHIGDTRGEEWITKIRVTQVG